ncbi:hypothetical protein [Actinoplanes sp. NBRC 101535]|uniref:hypothetical protein n=1 Tax=Actinoplanes sp. NBRC 101535 TaxID=3032196 RepID=UPI0024A34AA6|nr:hypothetical protein [Actinoplanes sp. NBRC 101535]GLY03028.1 hypothetical protein Acsp01_34070 [Actinoplanes sp. NBRC 101535]
MPANRGPTFQIVTAAMVAALSAVTWFAWLGWDSEYQIDSATGTESGPYEAWQIAGCAVSLLILLIAALLAGVRALPASAALTLGFTAAWTAQAARTDQTGLYMVGATMMVAGIGVASAIVSAIVIGLRDRRASRPTP